MGLMTYLSSFLLASQSANPTTSTVKSFTVQVWLDDFPLNHQFVSWYPISDPNKPGQGYFGIPIRAPVEPLPVEDRAIFSIDSASPGALSFSESSPKSTGKSNVVFVKQSGEVGYGPEVPFEFFKPYTGNFTTIDFTHWPDLETIHALDFTPPELVLGMFLACPQELGDSKERGYRLMAMTRMFKHPGCITLDWLVQIDINEETVVGLDSDPIGDYRGL
ncbi:hypothetical protein VTL71DRAFT_3994 [Oculimacula yallundae]|uniref:Uncharacterized protein n=1 Tax=Oculimacula yallundae TaxID=86028 RepID=A0ABR4C4K6_9HELO